MIALLLAAAIGQTENAAELHERWQIAESVLNDELASFNKSARERYEAIQREPYEERKRKLSEQAYKREMSPLLFGIRRAVDKTRLKYLRASGELLSAAL